MSLAAITNNSNLDVQVQLRELGDVKIGRPAIVDVKITQFGKEASTNGNFPILKQVIIPGVGKTLEEAKTAGLTEAVALMGLN